MSGYKFTPIVPPAEEEEALLAWMRWQMERDAKRRSKEVVR